jgi:uncharacterized protein YcbX
MKVRHLYIYPIKSLGGIELTSSIVESRGLRYDRRFMLVDENGKFLTQRSFPKLATLRTSLSENGFRITPDSVSHVLDIPFEVTVGDEISAQIWDDVVKGIVLSNEANQFFSSYLDRTCRLVYMPDDSMRPIDPKFGSAGDITSFSDGYPILMIGTASLDDLNARLEEKISWDRFRPNLVVETEIPFEEDDWSSIQMGDNSFRLVKPCARCVMTTVNQQTAIAGKEPLRTLAAYRSVGNKVLFGMNTIPSTLGGEIHKGASVIVSRKSISEES